MLGNTFLTHCWACKTEFSSELKEHRHHLVPRAYGGVDGPQVSLCDTHHTRLHEVALRLIAGKPFYDLLSKDREQNARVLYLAQIVVNAKLATDNDPNKAQLVVLHLRKEHKEKLKELKNVYGWNRQRLIEFAVESLHRKHFLEK